MIRIWAPLQSHGIRTSIPMGEGRPCYDAGELPAFLSGGRATRNPKLLPSEPNTP